MEKMRGSALMDQKALMIEELAKGVELVKQLRTQVLVSSTDKRISSRDDDQALNHSLVDKMLSVFDKSISLAKLFNFTELHQVHSDSPRSLAHSCRGSEDSSHDLRLSKKRKRMPLRIEWVRVSPGGSVSVLGGPLDDGYSWRKYGQKEILKAKYPRGYYRCTHRHTLGCLATKQVQKSNEDPSIYQVIYKGEHTCTQDAHLAQAHKNPKQAQIKAQPQPQSQPFPTSQRQCHMVESNRQEATLGLGPDVGPKVEPIEKQDEAQNLGSLSFNSAQCEPAGLVEDCMPVSFPPGFCPPAASESNCFPVSPSWITAFDPGKNVQTSESDLNESTSGPSSGSNSPNFGDFEFPSNMLEDIDVNFSFDFDQFLCHI